MPVPPASRAAAAACCLAVLSAAQAPQFTAEDMLDIVQISGRVAVSPDGTRIAYVLPDMEDEWNVLNRAAVGYLHVQGLAGGDRDVALTRGRERSANPVWSPNGLKLAFYVETEGETRVAVWDGTVTRYGEPFAGPSRTAPQWAGNGRLVYTRSVAPPPAEDPPRVQVLHSTDEVIPGDAFFTRATPAVQLATVDLDAGIEQLLVEEPVPLRGFEVSPDGRWALTQVAGESRLWPLSPPGPGRVAGRGVRMTFGADGRLQYRQRSGLFAFSPDEKGPAEGGSPRPVTDGGQPAGVRSPDGQRNASLVADPSVTDPEIEPPQPGMYTIARPFLDLFVASADGETVNLTADIKDQISSPVWSGDGSELYFRAVDNESYDETIYRYTVADQELTALLRGQESYSGLTAIPGGLLVSIQSAVRPADLWRIDAVTGGRRRVTELNPQLERFEFSAPELFHFHNADGDRLGALLNKPVGMTEGFPVITYVYEKLTNGIHRFNARNQIFLTHGYGILMPNVKVKVGETGTSFVKSVVPAVNAVRAMDITNDKFGLWGGSFGAYATSFVITQTNTFDCAVSRATPPELFRNWASGRDRDSDNIESGQARMGGSPFEYMERYISQSAFFHLDKVETPVLIMHGVKDMTILFGEGEMMFYALRRLGKEATFVIYHEGDHSLSRHSRADTLDVNRRMLDWFEKHLKPAG